MGNVVILKAEYNGKTSERQVQIDLSLDVFKERLKEASHQLVEDLKHELEVSILTPDPNAK